MAELIYTVTSPNSTWLVTSHLDTFDVSVKSMHFGCVELVGTARLNTLITTSSTRRAKLAQHIERVVSRRDVTSQVEFGLSSDCDFFALLRALLRECQHRLPDDSVTNKLTISQFGDS